MEATRQAADGSFTLGPVANATLLNSTYLRLEGVPATVAWLQYTPQRSAGTLPTVRPLPLCDPNPAVHLYRRGL